MKQQVQLLVTFELDDAEERELGTSAAEPPDEQELHDWVIEDLTGRLETAWFPCNAKVINVAEQTKEARPPPKG